jgi:4'-phosphopantetheinyl transferase
MRKQNVLRMKDTEASWFAPPESLALKSDEVHVWRASLEMTPSQVSTLKQILSPNELCRAGRFYFQKDRDHFVIARGLLRTILSKYVSRDPDNLHFCYGPNGKPALTGETGRKFRFNVSHSHGLSLFAVALDRNIGVDLEYIRSDLSDRDLAEQFLSPRELLAFWQLAEDDRPRGFFTWWTRKEAYLKARGQGLSSDLKQFEVVPVIGCPAEFPEVNGTNQEETSWSLMDLAVMPGYAAALAVEGRDLELKCWQWGKCIDREVT